MIQQLFYPSIKPIAWFHAYIACSVIGLRWGKFTATSTYCNRELKAILQEYLAFACGEDEWTKGRIIEAGRGLTASKVKQAARQTFPSLFPPGKRARSLSIPDELEGEEVNFDLAQIESWKERVKAIKQEISMSENATAQEATDATGSSAEGDAAKKNSRVTVNFTLPQGVDPKEMTLENYKDLTGKRYRMTGDQTERVKAGTLSREQAFEDSKALAIEQLGGKQDER